MKKIYINPRQLNINTIIKKHIDDKTTQSKTSILNSDITVINNILNNNNNKK